MTVECCDLCKKPMCSYTDKSGIYWEGISFQSKKYKRRVSFMFDTWTEYLSICGRCRAEIANKRSEEEAHYGDICDSCAGKDICGMAKSCKHDPQITSCYGYKEKGE